MKNFVGLQTLHTGDDTSEKAINSLKKDIKSLVKKLEEGGIKKTKIMICKISDYLVEVYVRREKLEDAKKLLTKNTETMTTEKLVDSMRDKAYEDLHPYEYYPDDPYWINFPPE